MRNCVGEAEHVAQDSTVAFEVGPDGRKLGAHLEAGGAQQAVERRERGFTVAALVGGNGRLRHASPRGDLTLAQSGASAGITEEGGEPTPVLHTSKYIRS